jgi:purine-binding chemotaxis protein CheW
MIELIKAEATAPREMIVFLVGAQEFCIDVVKVREIRAWTPATPIPHTPSFVCGVINLRGTVLPIVDFAARLGLKATEPTSRHAILVAEVHEKLIGLLAEGVSEILTVGQTLIQPTPDVASQSAKDFVSGIIAIDGRMISLIDLHAVFPRDETEAAA